MKIKEIKTIYTITQVELYNNKDIKELDILVIEDVNNKRIVLDLEDFNKLDENKIMIKPIAENIIKLFGV